MQNEWKGFEQVSDANAGKSRYFLFKRRSYTVENVCNLPTDKKFIKKIKN
jgi:hypothetical protein